MSEQPALKYISIRSARPELIRMAKQTVYQKKSWWLLNDEHLRERVRLANAIDRLDHVEAEEYDDLYGVIRLLSFAEAYSKILPEEVYQEVVYALERARRLYEEQKAIRQEAQTLVENLVKKVAER